ncbi:MAG: hypothetical protein COA79_17935 [Planctomycetota bacterium]|nr:MAG: hypothetical protein COA79_17935 [Planctomycetota bacterium]
MIKKKDLILSTNSLYSKVEDIVPIVYDDIYPENKSLQKEIILFKSGLIKETKNIIFIKGRIK